MKLVYSFTTKMQNYDDNDWQMLLYRASIIKSKKLGYSIKLYGCNFAYDSLKDLIDEYVDITNEEFILTDDLKIYIHSKEDLDCITFDGDIILENALTLPVDCDMIYERKGIVIASKVKTKFKKYLDIFKNYDIESVIPEFNYCTNYACNVGILKFNNQTLKDIFIKKYYIFREFYFKYIDTDPKLYKNDDPAIIICEYTFACLLDELNYTGKECNCINNYIHYMSLTKFTPIAWRHVNSIINPVVKIL
jgi:hypothetical protein